MQLQALGGRVTLLARATREGEGAIVPDEASEGEDHSPAMRIRVLLEKNVTGTRSPKQSMRGRNAVTGVGRNTDLCDNMSDCLRGVWPWPPRRHIGCAATS